MFFAIRRGVTDRRGQALSGTLIGLAILGAFALTAIIVQPNLLQGGFQRAASDSLPAAPDRRETLEKLAALIGSSAEVIAVHQRGGGAGDNGRGERRGSPFVEVVLRLHDERGSEFIKPEEIAVISHSRVLQTVMFYSRGHTAGEGGRDEGGLLFARAEAAAPEFCNQWRLDPAVEPRIIAAGVSDLHAELLHDRSGNRVSMRLGLTWPGDSPDAQEQAEVVLEVRSHALQ